MSICIAAAVILGIMGIFSAKYRRWAKEAFSCVGRRLTLRPCESSFNQRVKAKVSGKLMNRSPGGARFVNKHFEAISWVFTIILFASLALTALTVYNLAVYGTCDPVNPDQCLIGTEPTCGGGENCQPCQCDGLTCESPDYIACGGDCSCKKDVCEGS
ncbi:MAG: hypothetical protein ABIH55_00890 [Nanoarchaeota archaeon]